MSFLPSLNESDIACARNLREYSTDEVLSVLVRLYLHGGPVDLRVDDDFVIEAATLFWYGDEPQYLRVTRGQEIDDEDARGVEQVLARHMVARGWRPSGARTPTDPQQALRTALDDFVLRCSLSVSGGFPIHAGEAIVHVYPTPFGDTRYWVVSNGHSSTDIIRGGPEEALKAAKDAIDRRARALGGPP